MKKLLPHNKTYSPLLAVLWNLLLVYLVYQIARLEYYLENTDYLSYSVGAWKGGLVFDTSAILYTNALYVVMMLFPLHWKENAVYQKLCKWIFVIVNSIAFAINLADSVYFRYTMRRTTTTVFQEFSNEGNLGSIFATELLRHWYLVLLFVGVVAWLWFCYFKPCLDYHKLKSWLKYDIACLLSLLLYAPFCVAGMRGGFTRAVRPITFSNANQYVQRPIDAALVLNTPFALFRSIGKNVFVVPSYFSDEKELASIYSPIHQSSTLHSKLSPKNVVILIVESFGREYIGALNKDLEGGKYKGYTPYVDVLISKSTTFKYSFCNGRKSIDGMPSILSSIPMFVEPFILTPSSMNDYTGLAGILGAEGYETAEYEEAKGTNDFDGNWAIWDEPFLQYYAEEMGKMKQPFMTAVFTASSHHPYRIPEKYKDVYPEEGLIMHKCVRYTDMAIGKFLEACSKQPWFKNTIFVI